MKQRITNIAAYMFVGSFKHALILAHMFLKEIWVGKPMQITANHRLWFIAFGGNNTP